MIMLIKIDKTKKELRSGERPDRLICSHLRQFLRQGFVLPGSTLSPKGLETMVAMRSLPHLG